MPVSQRETASSEAKKPPSESDTRKMPDIPNIPKPDPPGVWPPPPVGFDAPTPAKPQKKLLTGRVWLDYLLGFAVFYGLGIFVRAAVLPWAFGLFHIALSLRLGKCAVVIAFLPISILASRAMRAHYPSIATGTLNGGFGQLGVALAQMWEGHF